MAALARDLMARTEERVRNEPRFALAALADAVEQFKAGSFNTFTVKELLHCKHPRRSISFRRRGKLLGLAVGNSTWFPAWQFRDGRVRSDLSLILHHATAFSTDPIASTA